MNQLPGVIKSNICLFAVRVRDCLICLSAYWSNARDSLIYLPQGEAQGEGPSSGLLEAPFQGKWTYHLA